MRHAITMDDKDREFEDLEAMVEEVNDGFEDELRAILAKGISLYEGDDEGNVYEITPGGQQFLVELQGDKLTRIRAAGYHPVFSTITQSEHLANRAKTNREGPEARP